MTVSPGSPISPKDGVVHLPEEDSQGHPGQGGQPSPASLNPWGRCASQASLERGSFCLPEKVLWCLHVGMATELADVLQGGACCRAPCGHCHQAAHHGEHLARGTLFQLTRLIGPHHGTRRGSAFSRISNETEKQQGRHFCLAYKWDVRNLGTQTTGRCFLFPTLSSDFTLWQGQSHGSPSQKTNQYWYLM